jgi:uronate dehydrogenase
MHRILITGAAGKIGSALRRRYPVLRLSDVAGLDPARAGAPIASSSPLTP